MSKHTLKLDTTIRENYSFFCPDSGLHLDVLRPQATIELESLTPSIRRAINAKTLIYVEGEFEFANCPSCGYLEESVPAPEPPPEPPKPPEPPEELPGPGVGTDGGLDEKGQEDGEEMASTLNLEEDKKESKPKKTRKKSDK